MLEQKPASASAFLDRGLVQLNGGEYDKAIADFSQALALQSDNAWFLANRGIAHVWRKDFDGAEKDLSAAERIDPKNPVAMRARGLAAELKGNYDQAIALFSAALRTDPGDAFSLNHRAASYRAASQYDKALADTDTLLALGSKEPELRLLRANILYGQGDNAGAAREAEQLVLKHPREAFAQVAAGRIFARVGMNDRSMAAFGNAIAIKPEAYIYINRAQSRPLGDRIGRLADLDAALKLDPADSSALAEKAEQLAVEGKLADAVALYDQAIADDPDNGHYALRRANLLYKAGRKGEAEAIFAARRAKAVTWNDFNSLCWAKATAGIMLDAALKECNEAVRLGPDSMAALDSRAFVLLRLGRIDEALADYGKALATRPMAPSYMGRAIAFTRKGDQARAAADRNEALKLDPHAETRFAEYGLKL
jgi:tetratricopeptide (TPR) repeat protein